MTNNKNRFVTIKDNSSSSAIILAPDIFGVRKDIIKYGKAIHQNKFDVYCTDFYHDYKRPNWFKIILKKEYSHDFVNRVGLSFFVEKFTKSIKQILSLKNTIKSI